MRRIILVVLSAAVLVGGFGVWWFVIRDSAPPKATLTERSTVVPTDGAGADGSYSVRSDATTYAGLRIDEQFSGIGSHTAVMRTPAVTGTLTVSGAKVTGVTVTADLTRLESKDAQPPGVFPVANRVGALAREGLDLTDFPTAKFALSGSITLPAAPAPGKRFSVEATGRLTLHGVTKTVSVPITAVWNGEVIDVQGHVPVRLADYGMTPPDRGFVKSADTGTMEFILLFTK